MQERIRLFDQLKLQRDQEFRNEADFPRVPIQVQVVKNNVLLFTVEAVSWQTLPVELIKDKTLSVEHANKLKELVKTAVVSKVYVDFANSKPIGRQMEMADSSGLGDQDAGDGDAAAAGAKHEGELWDLLRPLERDCQVEFLDFDSDQGKMVFWHSSAHVLGECLECGYGCQLTVGPPTKNGFFYDCYMGNKTIDEEMKQDLEVKAKQVCQMETDMGPGKQKQVGQRFERLVVTKLEALELFKANPFKAQMISSKIANDTDYTTVYRCGPMVDLCPGPHLRNTREIKGFSVLSCSQANFLGKTENDSLQRVYGVSFPDEGRLTQHLQNLKEAKENDHRVRGKEQQLFFFHPLSPGSAFFEPSGTRIYNKLMEFIRKQYRIRGYEEVVTPNIYNVELWKTSGHWEHYSQNMFSFTDGEALDTADETKRNQSTFALKPMNCPGHCLLYANHERSWRELPMRIADFGVLHRNELSGALTGLTRVRRFQQDDAHIFCTRDQIKSEVVGALEFMKFVYGKFGMTYKLERSTRPAKAAGLETPEGVALWDDAEQQLADAMNEFSGVGTWRDNPGDGAFYGPKIDIKVFDCQGRMHQCATVQLDFQNPIRFNLQYDSHAQKKERPVMIHRAMLGSVERFLAITSEHFRGRWPFWLSPRQAMIVPMLAGNAEQNLQAKEFAKEVHHELVSEGFFVELPNSANEDHRDVIKSAFHLGTKFCLCIGPKEIAERTLSVCGRQPAGSKSVEPVQLGTCSVKDLKQWFKEMEAKYTLDEDIAQAAKIEGRAIFTENIHGKKKDPGAAGEPKKQQYQKQNKRKQQDEQEVAEDVAPVAVAAPVTVAAPAKPEPAPLEHGDFVVGSETFKTCIPKLKGQRFATYEAYLKFLSE